MSGGFADRSRQRSMLHAVHAGLASIVMGCLAGPALAQLRIVDYNCAALKGDNNAFREVITDIAADDKPGFAVAPHILVFQEVPSSKINQLEALVDAAVPGINYVRGTYTSSPSEDGSAGAQAVFYRSDMVIELPAGHVDLDTGAGRKTDRWQFQLVGYSSPQAKFYVYGSHLKASSGSANEAIRLAGAQTIRANSDGLPPTTHIIYCGDLNLYDNGEPAYLAFLSAGNGQAFDPLGIGSWAGAANAIKHSQSPRDIVAGGLVGGGMDDRFDFQLSTAEFQDGNGLSLILGTYRSFGNDGQHYNLAINTGNNTYYPGDIARSNAVADLLFDASDHIPVVVDYQIPGVLSAAMPTNLGKVIKGAALSVNVTTQNIAAGLPVGIDELSVQVVGTGAVSGTTTVVAALAPSVTLVPLAVNTGTVGPLAGGAVVTALSEATQNATFTLSTTCQVVRPANASFSAVSDVNTTTVSASAPVGTRTVPLEAAISNLGFDRDQALLDIDTIVNLGGGFSLVSGLQTDIGAGPGILQFAYAAEAAIPGVYVRDVIVNTSDENLPGASLQQLQLHLEVTITASGDPADLDRNGVVDAADLAILLGAWGTGGVADLDGSGVVDGADLAILLGAWL